MPAARRGVASLISHRQEIVRRPSMTNRSAVCRLREALGTSFASSSPDVVFYNAGTDILAGDPLGRCTTRICLPAHPPIFYSCVASSLWVLRTSPSRARLVAIMHCFRSILSPPSLSHEESKSKPGSC